MFRVKVSVFLGGVSYFNFESFGLVKIVLRFIFVVGFSVSETDLLVESQLCNVVILK